MMRVGRTSRVEQMQSLQQAQLQTFIVKNADYGDSFAEHGPVGVLVRIGDKLKRLQNITKSGITLVDNEGLRDTAMDLSNYALMLVMLLDEEDDVNA